MSEIDRKNRLAEAQGNKGKSSSKATNAADSREDNDPLEVDQIVLEAEEVAPRGTTPSQDDPYEKPEESDDDESSETSKNSRLSAKSKQNIASTHSDDSEDDLEDVDGPPLIPENLEDVNKLILLTIQQMIFHESESTRKLLEPYHKATQSSLSESIKQLTTHLSKSHDESMEFYKTLDTQDTVLKCIDEKVMPVLTSILDRLDSMEKKFEGLKSSVTDERSRVHQELKKVGPLFNKGLEAFEGMKRFIALKEDGTGNLDKNRTLLNVMNELMRNLQPGNGASSEAGTSSKASPNLGLIEGLTRTVAVEQSNVLVASDKKKSQRCFICGSLEHGRHCLAYPRAEDRFAFFVASNRCVKCGQPKGVAEHICLPQYQNCKRPQCIETHNSNPQAFSLAHHALLCPTLIAKMDKKPKKSKAKLITVKEEPQSSDETVPPVNSSEQDVKPAVEGESAPPVAPKLSRRAKRALQKAKVVPEVEPSAKRQKKQKKTTVAKSAEQPVTNSTQTLN